MAFYYNDILRNSYKQIFSINIIEENENICLQLNFDSQKEYYNLIGNFKSTNNFLGGCFNSKTVTDYRNIK